MADVATLEADVHLLDSSASPASAADAWRQQLPRLSVGPVTLREAELSDAPTLAKLLAAPEVSRYISPPPSTVAGFEEFISASRRMRASGEGACFVVTYGELDEPIGLVQLRLSVSHLAGAPMIGGAHTSAEWGFALGSSFWGTGIFRTASALVLEFAFGALGVHRLEARCAVKNGRGGQALIKIGAVPEGILRDAFVDGPEPMDQVLYTILDKDWRAFGVRAQGDSIVRVH
jgi:ribosomal-protein-alanine N-acetyltransferase